MERKKSEGKGKNGRQQVPRVARNGKKEKRGQGQERETAGSSRCSEWKERKARARARTGDSRFLALLGMERKKSEGNGKNGRQRVPRVARNGKKEKRGQPQERETAGSSRCSEWKERKARATARTGDSGFLALLGMERKKSEGNGKRRFPSGMTNEEGKWCGLEGLAGAEAFDFLALYFD
jgi:hypothetical protein